MIIDEIIKTEEDYTNEFSKVIEVYIINSTKIFSLVNVKNC